MSNLMQSEEAFTRFIEEFRDENEEVKYEQALSEIAVKGQKSIVIEFMDLYNFDPELARLILNSPEDHLHHFELVAFHRKNHQVSWQGSKRKYCS